jgi:hypothetical protein
VHAPAGASHTAPSDMAPTPAQRASVKNMLPARPCDLLCVMSATDCKRGNAGHNCRLVSGDAALGVGRVRQHPCLANTPDPLGKTAPPRQKPLREVGLEATTKTDGTACKRRAAPK